MSHSNSNPSSTPRGPGAIAGLLSGAASVGVISPGTAAALSGDLGAVVVAGAAGADLDTIAASEVTLVTLLIDASSSIHGAGLEQAVRDGYNALLDAFGSAHAKDELLVAAWRFNDDVAVLHAYVPLDDAVRLSALNYAAVGTTRLYDTWCDALAANVAYAQLLRENGTPCRSIVVVVTDGEDCGSRRTATDCARLSKELLASEQFVLAFVGVGEEARFRPIARQMGIPDGSVEVTGQATAAALRRVLRLVSQATIQVSRGQVTPGPGVGFFRT